MKTKNLKVLACAGLLCAAAVTAHAQQLKVGYVDVQRVIAESDAGKAAQARLESEFGKRDKDLRDLDMRLHAAADQLEKEAPTLSETERIRRGRSIADQNRDLDRKRREFQEDLEQRKGEENAALNDRVGRALKQVVDAEKFDLILQENVTYAAQRVDISRKVIQAVNAQK
ncbi:OmpH family outer membrane protein [Paucibacter sp. R3-3]|uniref:OmpH family outer membrane protein n=1 Tax=Roseateles agri TaxID=3098619 RepID=A0ABU5DE95_9BURK|nr:OmpH family outer membrane protein [Paucibacter sp. R3-3]MDY0744602.1 OmpH family outer membrane protein [Paucibacter sp. R3-3]